MPSQKNSGSKLIFKNPRVHHIQTSIKVGIWQTQVTKIIPSPIKILNKIKGKKPNTPHILRKEENN
jgi:hypothetical protein